MASLDWWHFSKEKPTPNEGYFVDRYPLHVARAFVAVDYHDHGPLDEDEAWRPFQLVIAEDIQAFAQRWGGVDEATFVRVLQQGSGRDRLVAIFAIGYSQLPQAAELLTSFLASPDLLERCAAAVVLGFRRDERALPVLEEYLLCDVPTDERGFAVPGADHWFRAEHPFIVRLLATWGSFSITALLRTAYLQMWEEEQQQDSRWYTYELHDALLYALGRRGAVAALHGIEQPIHRQRLAMIFLAAGSLHVDEYSKDVLDDIWYNRALQEALAGVLTDVFALSEQESQACVAAFHDDYQGRKALAEGRNPERWWEHE